MIKLIACIDSEFGIGLKGKMPWPTLYADMKYFRRCTLGGTVVVGRKTFDEIGGLPERETIIYRGQKQKIIDLASWKDVWIIGGGEVYMEFIPIADEIHLTRILGESYNCDAFFPAWNPIPEYICENYGFYNEGGISFVIERYVKL